MVSSALMFLVVGCAYSMLSAGMRYHKATSANLEMQQDSLLALVWLNRELSEASPRTVSFLHDPEGVLFASPRDDAGNIWIEPNGLLRWPKFVAYYLGSVNGTPCLLRKEQYLDDPDLHTDPPPTTPPVPELWQDGAYYRDLEISPRIVARHVESMSFTGTNPVELQVTVRQVEMGRTFSMSLSAKVSMKN